MQILCKFYLYNVGGIRYDNPIIIISNSYNCLLYYYEP